MRDSAGCVEAEVLAENAVNHDHGGRTEQETDCHRHRSISKALSVLVKLVIIVPLVFIHNCLLSRKLPRRSPHHSILKVGIVIPFKVPDNRLIHSEAVPDNRDRLTMYEFHLVHPVVKRDREERRCYRWGLLAGESSSTCDGLFIGKGGSEAVCLPRCAKVVDHLAASKAERMPVDLCDVSSRRAVVEV